MRKALSEADITTRLATLEGWALRGTGGEAAIEKTFHFEDYYETMAFVNAVAFIAHAQDHHPDLSVHYSRCVVRYSTHDVGGVSDSDFAAAAKVDGLLA